MLYSHKFPPINLHIFESLFCVSSVLGIEDVEMVSGSRELPDR